MVQYKLFQRSSTHMLANFHLYVQFQDTWYHLLAISIAPTLFLFKRVSYSPGCPQTCSMAVCYMLYGWPCTSELLRMAPQGLIDLIAWCPAGGTVWGEMKGYSLIVRWRQAFRIQKPRLSPGTSLVLSMVWISQFLLQSHACLLVAMPSAWRWWIHPRKR